MAASSFGALLSSAAHGYGSLLKSHPYPTNAATSSLLMLLGDRAAQALEARASGRAHPNRQSAPGGHSGSQLSSWQRTATLVSWAALCSSPWWTFWYRAMNRRFATRPFAAVVATQVISLPFNAVFFSTVTAAEHAFKPDAWRRADELPAAIADKLRARLPSTLGASASFWPMFNYVNFAYCPPHLRNLSASGAALAWNVFISLENSGGVDAVAEAVGPHVGDA